MQNMKLAFKFLITFGIIHGITGQANANNVYTAYSGSQQGVTIRDANTLMQSGIIGTNFNVNGIAAGHSNNVYLTSGNQIFNYSTNGSLLNSFTWYDNTIIYGDTSVGSNNIYTAYSGSQQGVTIRDAETLAQSAIIGTGFNINGVSAGHNDNVYLTSGNSIFNYSTNGSLLNSFTWYDNSITYGDIAVSANNVFTVYAGSQQGVTIRDLDTLTQTGLIIPGFDIDGIAVGFNDDVYLTSGNQIFNYSTNGSLLNSFTWYDNTIAYGDISVAPVPVPAAAWLFGSGLIGLIGLRRKISR
ncbi:MAG: hypothetical protein ABL903_09810 [Methylococcales bacterium]